MNSSEELAKLHCLHSLFEPVTGKDPYLTRQIQRAIEFALTGSPHQAAPLRPFSAAVLTLLRENPALPATHGMNHIDLDQHPYDPLWLRQELVAALKNMAGYKTTFLLISGLRSGLCPKGKYWTKRMQRRYADALDYINALAAALTTPRTTLNIIFL